MGICSICASLKNMAKGGRSDEEIRNYKILLKEYRESQSVEQSKALHHRQKALLSLERYMCMIMDGMDQKKTCLPHFQRLPKDIRDECLVQMHLVGCLLYSPKSKVYHLKEVYDFKRLCMDGGGGQCKVLAHLHNISFNRIFLIKRSGVHDNATLLYAKQYSSSTKREPQEGCMFLLHVPNDTIQGTNQIPYDDHEKGLLEAQLMSKGYIGSDALKRKRKILSAQRSMQVIKTSNRGISFFKNNT